jgi:hypothetical protein
VDDIHTSGRFPVPRDVTTNLERRLQEGEPLILGRPDDAFDLSTLPTDIWDERTVSARAVVKYCSTPDKSERKHIDGVKIVGSLDLSSLHAENRSIEISNCYLSGPVNLGDAFVHKIDFSGSFFAKGVFAKNLHSNVFRMCSAITEGRVDLRYVEIDGPCELTGSAFRERSPESLDIRGAMVTRSLLLMRTCIRGSLIGSGLTVRDLLDGTDIIIEGADWIEGELDAYGEPRRPLEARHIAVVLDFACISGPVRLRASRPDAFVARGLIRMQGSQLGFLSCDGAHLCNPHAVCLSLERTVVTNSVHLRKGFEAHGSVSLFAADIGDALELTDAALHAPDSTALSAERVRVAGPVLLRRFSADGLVRFLNSAMGSFVECTDCSFTKAEPDADRHGYSELPTQDMALSFENAAIKGRLILGKNFSALGRVKLSHARIDGDLVVNGGKTENIVNLKNDTIALEAHDMSVQRAIIWHHVKASGFVDIRYSSCAILDDDIVSWPIRSVCPAGKPDAQLSELDYRFAREGILRRPVTYASGLAMDGFTYQVLGGQDVSWKSRRAIFQKIVDWAKPQPYLQLAEVYRRRGATSEARKVQVARLNTTHHPLSPWGWILRGLIGYGYRPLRAVWFLIAVALVSGFIFSLAAQHDDFIPARYPHPPDAVSSVCEPQIYPCFHPYVYSVDSILPVLTLQQRDYWMPDLERNRWIGYMEWYLSAIGWLVGLLVVAGFTNLVRKE